jgi:MFS family permease
VWCLFAVYGIFYGLTEPVEKALLTDLAPAVARGRVFGLYNFIVGIASMPAGLITGALWNRWGATVALDAAAGFAAVACLLLFAWDLRRARAAPINRASDIPLDKRASDIPLDTNMDGSRRE